jgi:predicted metal-dependent HD superfamily phosphohydrolase
MITKEDIEKAFQDLSRVPAIRETLFTLQRELPSILRYHSFGHTLEVLRDAIEFALIDKLSERNLELLALAAVTHDAGFIHSRIDNEPLGAKYAREIMERMGGYSSEEIELVEQMVLDTALVRVDGDLKQVPNTELSKYLLDADLGNFGRDDFFEKSELQRAELGDELYRFRLKTLSLLSAHVWHTNAAKVTRQRKKDENISKLKALIERCA